jgi:hypothetical protein
MIAALKAKGLVIHNVERTGVDRDGRKTYFGIYCLEEESVQKALDLVEAYEHQEGMSWTG